MSEKVTTREAIASKNEFEKTIARMKESHEIEVEYLKSCKLKLLKEVQRYSEDKTISSLFL